jgi:flagellar protein FlaJ
MPPDLQELLRRKPTKEDIVQELMPVAEQLQFLFPDMERKLSQAQMDKDPVTHLAEAVFRGLSTGLMIGVGLVYFGWITEDVFMYQMAVALTPVSTLFGFFTYAKLPDIKAKKRVRELEKELPYALRHVLIEVKAGISVYQAIVSVSDGYGEASDEFKRIAKDMNSGLSEIEALERAVVRNPSMQFRRALWQIINALKSGSDVSKTLESLVDAIIQKQILSVQQYGKELNPYTLMYMMFAIILPSLGVTFMIVLSTFTGTSITQELFYMILIGLIIFQALFINMIKAKRPKVKT